MIKNTVSIEEFRVNLADLVSRVMYGKDRVVIKKYNREAAILISLEDYEKLLDPTKRLSKTEWDEAVRVLDSVRKNIPQVEPKLLDKEINQAVREVRVKNNKIKA